MPIPTSCGVFYWEVEVLSTGRDGFIGVGLATGDVKLERLPGWDARSYGYHGDDGHAFRGSGTGRPYGPTYGAGDIVGVLFNLAEKTISFTKNGIDLGVAFERVTEERLHPSIGLRTPGEEVRAFFPPAGPFRGDVASIRAAAAARAAARALCAGAAALVAGKGAGAGGGLGPKSEEVEDKATSLALELALDHLRHVGAKKAAAALVREIAEGGGSGKKDGISLEEENSGTMMMTSTSTTTTSSAAAASSRLAARRHLLDGDIPAAREAAEAAAPGALKDNAELDFALDVQHFVELVRRGDDDGAMAHGASALRAARAEAAAGAEGKELLADAMSLLAYTDPAASPAGKLLALAVRRPLAEDVEACLRAAAGLPPRSVLDAAARQAVVAHAELAGGGSSKGCGDPDAALVDLPALLGLSFEEEGGGGSGKEAAGGGGATMMKM